MCRRHYLLGNCSMARSLSEEFYWRLLPAENGTSTVGMRAIKLVRNEVRDGGTVCVPFELSGLLVQPPHHPQFFIMAELGFLHR